MILLSDKGKYMLYETSEGTKILIFDNGRTFAWVDAPGIGEILVASGKKTHPERLISQGNFRFYDVKNEPKLTDLKHLELFVGDGKWQGYLLPTGLPTENKKRSRIISTNETITRSAIN